MRNIDIINLIADTIDVQRSDQVARPGKCLNFAGEVVRSTNLSSNRHVRTGQSSRHNAE